MVGIEKYALQTSTFYKNDAWKSAPRCSIWLMRLINFAHTSRCKNVLMCVCVLFASQQIGYSDTALYITIVVIIDNLHRC